MTCNNKIPDKSIDFKNLKKSFRIIEVYSTNKTGTSTSSMFLYAGSGFILKSKKDFPQVIVTARHICHHASLDEEIKHNKDITYLIIDELGNKSIAKSFSVNDGYDVCLLSNFKENLDNSGFSIADRPVQYGEKVYSLSAPKSFFKIKNDKQSGALPVVDGFYSGEFIEKIKTSSVSENIIIIDTYTLPSTFGASGSPIINKEGEVVGMIFAVLTGFNNITFSVPWFYLKQIEKYLNK